MPSFSPRPLHSRVNAPACAGQLPGVVVGDAMGEKTRLQMLMRPRPRQNRRQLRQVTLVLGSVLAFYCLLFVVKSPSHAKPRHYQQQPPPSEVLNNLSLGEAQCNAYFPGLTKEIDDVVAQGPFVVKQTNDFGPLQGRIKDGQLYVIHAQRKADLSREMVNSRTAALHQLHRALLTSPSPLPDTIFSLNFQDQPFGTAWAYSRHADPEFGNTGEQQDQQQRAFLMPHFSFWAWDLPFIGSMGRAAAAIARLEASYSGSSSSWHAKIPKAVWRGTTWFNSVHSPRLRQDLVAAARGQDWADVEPLAWTTSNNNNNKVGGAGGQNASNALPVEGFCAYKYVVHTEGIAYSGRFQFLQMCASVVLTPPIMWMQHLTHLARPLFSSDLHLGPGRAARAGRKGGGGGSSSSSWVPSDKVRRAWPAGYAPEEANIVFVAPDWSDLGDTVAWLEEHPDVAEGIARRQREMFVGGGYFSPAAETCYWRALVRGWAKMARTEGQGWEETEDIPFEMFSLTNGS